MEKIETLIRESIEQLKVLAKNVSLEERKEVEDLARGIISGFNGYDKRFVVFAMRHNILPEIRAYIKQLQVLSTYLASKNKTAEAIFLWKQKVNH